MTADHEDRLALLDRYGRWYGEERLAIAFTSTTVGDDAKRVVAAGWDRTAPLSSPDFGASYVAGRGVSRNPVVVLRPSNLIVCECDTEADLAAIQALKLPPTVTVVSSAPHKRHFWYRPPPELDNLPYVAFRFESGKLTADSGRYFLAPPSIHPSGATYRFLPGHGPYEMDIVEFPEYAYHGLSKRAKAETAAQTQAIAVDPGAKVQAGQRGDRIFRYASMLRRWGLSHDAILDACLIWNDDRCDPPIERKRVEMQVAGAWKMRGGQEIEYAVEHPKADLHVVRDDDDQPIYDDDDDDPDDDWREIPWAEAAYSVPPEPPAIHGLLYRGERHVVSGVTESAKSLINYWLHLEGLRLGFKIAVIDFEQGAHRARRMMEDVGATLEEIEQIGFYTPTSPPENGILRLVVKGYDFVLIDASVGAYDITGLDDNHRKEVEEFNRRWIRPLWKAGAATTLLDHVVKAVDARGKFTIGSERKVGQCDVHLGFEARKQLTRGGSGIVNVSVHKDRGAYLPRPTGAVFHLTSDPLTHAITVDLKPPPASATDDTGHRRHTLKMQQVSRFLEHPDRTPNEEEGFSANEVEGALTGEKGLVRPALKTLVDEGYVAMVGGPRNSKLHSSLRPYREEEDPLLRGNSPTSPHLPASSPSRGGRPHVPASPHLPLGSAGVRGGRHATIGEEKQPHLPGPQFSPDEGEEPDAQDLAWLADEQARQDDAHRRAIEQE